MKFVDYYKIMGVAEDASADEIKLAYRRLARKFHPDVSKESDSEEKFKQVAEAYQVLKDGERRAEYDELRRHGGRNQQAYTPPPGWQSTAGFDQGDFHSADAGQFSDFFEELFGQKAYARRTHRGEADFAARGQDIHSRLSISLSDAFDGVSLPIEVGKPTIQPDGSVRSEKRAIKVKIPKGVIDRQSIRLRGQGGPAIGSAPAGDLYIELVFEDDDVFSHDGKDINIRLPVMPWEAALGASVVVPTLGGKVNLTIPPDSVSGKKFRLSGRGLPGTPPGDQYVVLEIVVPPATTDEQRDCYRQMSKLWSLDPREKQGGRDE